MERKPASKGHSHSIKHRGKDNSEHQKKSQQARNTYFLLSIGEEGTGENIKRK
jgi:hypothetical protein